MNANIEKAREIFVAAVGKLSPDQWDTYLAEVCGGDAELSRRVKRLLQLDAGAGSFLEAPADAVLDTVDDPITERPGSVLGPYKLMEQIGEGGMGLVFVAEQQQPIHRRVAVKVIKPGMDTRAVIARFEAERQALALMDHPNIAKVLDAGTTESGRPYFVMELVKGVPITDYCDHNQLATRQRLELFLSVCQAIQHAHQKGIIHRDIKPSNVLVMSHDGTPVVRVIDFGVAKAIGRRLTDKTVYTQFTQMIGTPMYMSPEQAGESSLDVDTRGDIYSLGVLLYELLTGTTPFDKERLGAAGYDEIRRIIREEEPPKPSTRISTLGLAATTLSTQRKSDPKRLTQLFRGELDWIVMKCLEKDRNRRYETASAFAADIERYLHDEPVLACPPSWSYHVGKFVRRYRAVLGTTALVLLVLVAGVVASTWQAIQAERKRQEAAANFRKARQAVDEQFTLVSQSKLFDAPGFQPLQKDLLESALKFYVDFAQQRPDDPELLIEVAAAHLRLSQIHEALGGPYCPASMQQLEKGVEIVEQLLREPGRDPGLYTRLSDVKGGRSFHGGYSAPQAQAPASVVIPLFQRSATIWEELARINPTEVGFQSDLAGFYFALQQTQASVGQRAQALANIRKAHAINEKLVQQHPTVADYRAQLAGTHDQLAWRLRLSGAPEDIEYHFRQTIVLRQGLVDEYRNVPNYRFDLAMSHQSYGHWLTETGRPTEAEQAYRRGLILHEKLVSEFPQMPAFRSGLAFLHELLGHLYRDAGKMEKAEQAYREALKHFDKLAEEFPSNPSYRIPYSSYCLCSLLAASHREEEADRIFRKILEYQPDTPDGRNLLAWELAARPDPRFSDPKRAVELMKKAVEQAPDAGYIWNTLGLALYRNGDWREAVAALEKSMKVGEGGDSFDRFLLAMAHWRLGNKDQARHWYSLAVEWMENNEQHALDELLRQDLRRFHDEAAQLLGMKDQPTAKPRQKLNAKPRRR